MSNSQMIADANKAATERQNNPRNRQTSQMTEALKARESAMATFDATLEQLEKLVASL